MMHGQAFTVRLFSSYMLYYNKPGYGADSIYLLEPIWNGSSVILFNFNYTNL